MAGTFGVTFAEVVDRLTTKERGKGRLEPAPSRAAILESIARATPTSADPLGAGVTSPLAEQAYAGSTYYEMLSSDGLFTFEYPDETQYIDNDGAGDIILVKHLAP